MAPLYELTEARRSFTRGDETIDAVAGIDLCIDEGELLAVTGPSGSGKTTLLQLLGALDTPSAGTISFEGRDLATLGDVDLTELRLREIGFVFQQFNLIPTLTARENVEAALAPLGLKSAARRERALARLSEVGLDDRAEHLPSQLSGGQQQRVAIARALANDPAVILADEPTGNLDRGTGEEIADTLASLAESGRTVVIVTHDDQIAARAPRIVRLDDGHVQTAAAPRPDQRTGDVLVAGAAGGVGRLLVERLAASGREVRAMARRPEQVAELERVGVEGVLADLEADPSGAVGSADAVVFCAGAGAGSGAARKITVDLEGAAKLIEACERAGVRRFVMLSAMAADDPDAGPEALRPYLVAKGGADARLRRSSLDWTIVRPGRLTDDEPAGRVEVAPSLARRGEVARGDVAAVLAAVLDDESTFGATFELLAGSTPIDEAIDRLH